TAFRLPWCDVRVTREKLTIITAQDPYFERLRDVMLGLFSLLRHTPVRAIGINHEAHYQADSDDRWHKFGNLVAPKDIWKNVLDAPGLTNLSVEEQKRRDGRAGHVGCQIQPSGRFNPGIFVMINDHYDLSTADKPGGADELLEILEKSWVASVNRATAIMM